MPDALYADPSQRLPWLANATPAPQPRLRVKWSPLMFWAGAGAALVGAGWAWIELAPAPSSSPRLTAVAVPPPVTSTDAPAVTDPPTSTSAELDALGPIASSAVEAANEEPVRPERPRVKQKTSSASRRQAATPSADAAKSASSAPSSNAAATDTAEPQRQTLWSSGQTKGAAGRLVQIGAFSSRHKAKLGWRRMQRTYPAMGDLPAVVVPARNSKGRKFYRFQIGTTSHAHSEVLCQRMKRIDFSCAVIGLPWKERVER